MSTFAWELQMKRMLEEFEIDFYQERVHGHVLYTGRLWRDGGQVAEVSHENLYGVINLLDAEIQEGNVQ